MGNPNEIATVEGGGSESSQIDLEAAGYAAADVQKEVQHLDSPEMSLARKRYLRKLDLIILPMISVLYFFEYLDRGNVAVFLPSCLPIFFENRVAGADKARTQIECKTLWSCWWS